MRFSFDEKDLKNYDRIRCNKPLVLNKNVDNFGLLIDKSASYWVNKGSKAETNKYAERTNKNVPMANVIRKNRLICTKTEYAACMTIVKNFKAYKFRVDIQKRIMKKRIAIFHRKQLAKLGARSKSVSKRQQQSPRTEKKRNNLDKLEPPA